MSEANLPPFEFGNVAHTHWDREWYEPFHATVEGETGPAVGWVVNLLGRPVGDFTGGIDLRPSEIATVRLREQ